MGSTLIHYAESLAGVETSDAHTLGTTPQLHICAYRINRDLIVSLNGPPDQYPSAWYLVQRIGIRDGPVQALPRPNRLGIWARNDHLPSLFGLYMPYGEY